LTSVLLLLTGGVGVVLWLLSPRWGNCFAPTLSLSSMTPRLMTVPGRCFFSAIAPTDFELWGNDVKRSWKHTID
jgi:hypothetical protein